MPGPRGVITVNGNTERSLRTEEHTAALAAEAQSSLLRQPTSSAIKDPDTFKRARSNRQQDRLARPEPLHLGPSQMAKSVPRVHNYALKIPWAQVGRGGTTTARPKTRVNRTRRFSLCYFLSFRTLISGNPVQQYGCRTHDATTKEAESYVAPQNSQVVSDND